MTGFDEFLSRLGLLHDCTVTSFAWQPSDKKIVLEIKDFYWNFEGLPEYRGPASGQITLEGVERVEISIDNNKSPLRIYEFSTESNSSGLSKVLVTFSPAGKIAVTCRHTIFPDIPLP